MQSEKNLFYILFNADDDNDDDDDIGDDDVYITKLTSND